MAGEPLYERPRRLYSIADSALIELSESLQEKLTRDASELAARGITPAVISELAALTAVFDAWPSENVTDTATAIKTTARDTARVALRVMLEDIRSMAAAVFGESSRVYRSVGFHGMIDFSDREYRQFAEDAQDFLETYRTALESKGATLAFVAEVEAARLAFTTAYREMLAAEQEGISTTDKRVEKGNAVWLPAREACNTAMAYYNHRNPGKAAEYFALKKRGETAVDPPDAPTDLAYNAATEELTFVKPPTATSTVVQESADGTTFPSPGTSVTGNLLHIGPPGAAARYFRAKSRNDGGFGPESAVFMLAAATLAAITGFAYASGSGFSWNPAAEDVEMEASYDGGLTWNQILLGQYPTGTYPWTPPAGMFRIRRRDGALAGPWTLLTVTTP